MTNSAPESVAASPAEKQISPQRNTFARAADCWWDECLYDRSSPANNDNKKRATPSGWVGGRGENAARPTHLSVTFAPLLG